MKDKNRSRYIFAVVLALLGMLVTVYLIKQHYAEPDTSFCNVSAIVNCDVVNQSKYSTFLGIPVAILGFGTYTVLFVAMFGMVFGWWKKYSTRVLTLMTAFSGFGLAFSLYLTIVEFFVIGAVCMFCLAQQFIILALFLLLFAIYQRQAEAEV
ncbi:hypothetical protein COV82_00660 [Candidatus Peregrinibacteria bacterium CG11_big_fil_rev_8_21_14_0_20_46_8]|nr:MAG: hypothetical protein COV82_00660 [Candidatus Peregrinibacteria bacterium CG11_big_fil_rev_8_21_14_0_20_46_8]